MVGALYRRGKQKDGFCRVRVVARNDQGMRCVVTTVHWIMHKETPLTATEGDLLTTFTILLLILILCSLLLQWGKETVVGEHNSNW